VAQTCGNVVVHLIFSTKLRKPLIAPDIRPDLFAYLGGIVRELRGTAIIINGTCDHVHMLVRLRPSHSIAEIARIVKTNSSGWIRKKGHEDFAWQAGYGVFSVRRIECCGGYQVHRVAEGTSPEAIVSGGISGVS
jgi:REP element-mobilizing transposase RayT